MNNNKGNATVGVIIIILILVIGGYFLYRNSVKEKVTTPAVETGQVETPAAVNGDLSNVEAELQNLNLEDLDQGL